MKKKYQILCNVTSIFISIIFILFVTELLGFTSLSLAQGDIWTEKAPMPTARYNAAACTLDGKIYLFGGTIGSGTGAPATSVVEVYDSVSDTWSLITNMPKKITHPSACTLNGKIYIFGGTPREEVNPLATVYEYNPVNNTWVTKAPMPTARMNVVSCAVGGKIYVIGGQVSTGTGPSDAVEEYDPSGDNWTEKTKMPTARAHLCAGVVNDKIYAIGGVVPSLQSTSKVEEYNPATDTWTEKSSMQKARTGLTASTQNGKIYVIGGSVSPGSAGLATVEEYDPLKDNWIYKTDMPTARVALTSSTCNGLIYALGGAKGPWPFNPLPTNEGYTPHNDLLSLVEYVNLSRSYAIPGTDSVVISTKIKNPTGITLLVKIESPDQTIVDSLQLYDDGNHNDGNAGDSLYANIWPVLSTEERHYYVDLRVTRVDADTVVNHLDNIAVFTTVGPVQAAESPTIDYYYEQRYNRQYFFLVLHNKGSVETAVNLNAKISSADPRINRIVHHTRDFPDLAAGEIDTSARYQYYSFDYADDFTPDSTFNNPIKFNLTVFSNGYPFWNSTFDYVADTTATAIEDNFVNKPKQFALHQNYPNPFNPATRIRYSVSKPARMVLRVMNLLGQEMCTLVNEEKPAGCYEVTWDGKDDLGQRVASGVYLYRLESKDFIQTRKMIFLQ